MLLRKEGTYTGLCEVKAVVCAESRCYVLSRVRKRPFMLPGSVMAINTFVGTSQSSVCAVGTGQGSACSEPQAGSSTAGMSEDCPACAAQRASGDWERKGVIQEVQTQSLEQRRGGLM